MGEPGARCGALLLAWPQAGNEEAVWREHRDGGTPLRASDAVLGLPSVHCVILGNLMPSLHLFSYAFNAEDGQTSS